MQVVRINYFEAVQGKAAELYEFFQSIQPYISGSEGCIACEVLKNRDNHSQIIVLERWHSIEHHQQSVANFPREKMQSVMDLFSTPPRGSYYHA